MSLYLLIATVVFSLIFGFVALAISFYLQRQFELNYIKSYFYHQILIFLFGFYGLLGTIITHYLLIDFEINGELFKNLFSFLPFIGVPFMIVAWYLFIRISFELIEKEVSFRFTMWFFILLLTLFLIFGFLVPFVDYFQVTQNQINTHVFIVFIVIELITLLVVFANYFVFSNRIKDKRKLRFIKFYAITNGLLYFTSVVFLLISEKNIEFISGYTMLYFFKDIIPLIILNQYLKKNYVHPVNVIAENSNELFIEKFNISKRESEVIDEIVKGRTNKEISESLFISLQTVKDHVHNIFLKTGVKNRIQLSNLFRQFTLK